jgi:hypothetical protein
MDSTETNHSAKVGRCTECPCQWDADQSEPSIRKPVGSKGLEDGGIVPPVAEVQLAQLKDRRACSVIETIL